MKLASKVSADQFVAQMVQQSIAFANGERKVDVKGTATAVFNLVKSTLKWQDGVQSAMADLGLADKTSASPFVMAAVARLYDVPLTLTQRNTYALPRDSAAEKAFRRFMAVAFSSGENVWGNEQKSSDPVAKLVKAFGKLDAKQQRAFLKAIA